VHLEDALATLEVGGVDADLAVEAAGRSSAGSRMSGRLVAAMTSTDAFGSKPSISTSIWLSVCSRSS
jgi:hypothetical protein